jgi:hypothetical protein
MALEAEDKSREEHVGNSGTIQAFQREVHHLKGKQGFTEGGRTHNEGYSPKTKSASRLQAPCRPGYYGHYEY